MEKSALKSIMLSAISEELDLWLDKNNTITDGYEYENEFIKTVHKINHILLSKSLGDISCNRNKKKLHTFFGVLEVNKSHVLCQYTSKFGITSKLQEMMCLLAQSNVFEECENLLTDFLGLNVSAKQIQRVSEYHGEELEKSEKKISRRYT